MVSIPHAQSTLQIKVRQNHCEAIQLTWLIDRVKHLLDTQTRTHLIAGVDFIHVSFFTFLFHRLNSFRSLHLQLLLLLLSAQLSYLSL